MRKFSLLFFFCICSTLVFSQLKSHVDERFELTSIVFRLAGADEYNNNQVKSYISDIDDYFAPFKEHPLIRYVKEIREKDEVAYDAVSGITFQLVIRGNHIDLSPQSDKAAFLQSEPRWKNESMDKFIKLLNHFYKETKFKVFFSRHQDLYSTAENRFDGLLQTIHEEWFQSFYGEPLGNPAIYLSLCNGSSNYSMNAYSKDNSSNYGIVIGCSRVDKDGIPNFILAYSEDNKPYYDNKKIRVIIHEFSHHFSNPLVTKYEQEMNVAAEKMFPYVREQLAKYAYNDAKSILFEGLNELFVNTYFWEYKNPDSYNIYDDENRGFVWMRRAIRFMNNFYENRIIYPYIKGFMPQLVSFINTSGNHIDQIMDEYNHSFPYVVNVFPGINTTVSADIKEIRVDFSHPMIVGIGINYPENLNGILPQKTATSYWSKDMKTLIMPVALEKEENCNINLSKGVFQSFENFPMKEDFEILFKTAEK